MKKLIYALTVFLFLLSFSVFSEESDKKNFQLTENQIKTINVIKLMSEEISAEWINPYTIEVTLDPVVFSHLDKKQAIKSASELVKLLSGLGYEITKQSTCVKIIDPRLGELAYECFGQDEYL